MINAAALFWNAQVLKRYAVINAVPTLIRTTRTFAERIRNSTKRGMCLSNATARSHICLARFVLNTRSKAHVVSSVSISIIMIFNIIQ